MPERCPICDKEECGHTADEKLIRKKADEIAYGGQFVAPEHLSRLLQDVFIVAPDEVCVFAAIEDGEKVHIQATIENIKRYRPVGDFDVFAAAIDPRKAKRQSYSTTPLTIEVEDGVLTISIGVDMLALAAVGSSAWPAIRITDPDIFARDVARHIRNDEAEDGSTPLHRIFDAATEAMIEDCCEGVEWDEKVAEQGPPDKDEQPGWVDPNHRRNSRASAQRGVRSRG